MYRVIECLTQEHQLWLVSVAAAVCIMGSILSIRLTGRYRGVDGTLEAVYLGMASVITGATVWSTHFVAMLAYRPGYPRAYEPVATLGSLLLAIVGTAGATVILKHAPIRRAYIAAGIVLGSTISIMHYIGMSGYLVPGDLRFDPVTVVASVLLSVILSICAYHRLLYPVTRYCWLGGALLLISAICALHFTGMSAIHVELDPTVVLPEKQISEMVMGAIVVSVITILLLIGFASFGLETKLSMEAKDRAIHASNHDSLTGLPNRKKMVEHAEMLSRRLARDEKANIAVLFLDLNGFKSINDLHGHRIGDHVIREIAHRIAAMLPDTEMVARTGGDEFVVILSRVDDVHDVLVTAKRLSLVVERSIQVNDVELFTSVAIGVSTSMDDSREFDDLLNMADLAMYRAKKLGQAFCVFDPEMDVENREELQLISDLRQVCRKGELELVYQLQNDVLSLEPVGFEALLRWNHPTRGLVSPGVFIPIAEKSGLIREIGLWVLNTACLEAAGWDLPLTIAVNVAPQQIVEPNFVEYVANALRESGLPPARLELELTEESIVEDMAQTIIVMKNLKSLGVRIAMDDFGTGYSSLAMLKTFPFDKIKIDRSFVERSDTNPQRAAIIRATLILGEAFGIPILAEGVETAGELNFLQEAGCDTAQGYYFGKPMRRADMRKVTQIEALLKA